jgi:hypothetical protein
VTSPLIDAILSYLAIVPKQKAAACRPGVVDLAAAIRDRHHGGETVVTQALFEQLAHRLRR